MNLPSALIEDDPLSPAMANSPEVVADTNSVLGAQPDGEFTPVQRSRTKRFIAGAPDVPCWPETRFVALDANTRNLPSALIAT